jgi:hypothetical protein
MAKSSEHNALRTRIEHLGRHIADIRKRYSKDVDRSADAEDLAALVMRHADLRRRLADVDAHPSPDHPVVRGLEADFEGLMQSIDRWIARQDSKPTRT